MFRLRALVGDAARRKVFRALTLYLFGLWVLSQGIADLFPVFGLPDEATRMIVLAGLAGTPGVLLFSWSYDLTLRGIVRRPLPREAGSSVDATDPRGSDVGGGTAMLREPTCGPQGPEATLTVIHLDEQRVPDRSRRFHGRFLLGRDYRCDVQVYDVRVSRQHAEIWFADERWWIRDLRSRNGTFLDGRPVQAPTPLPANGRVTFAPDHAGPALLLRPELVGPTAVVPSGQEDAGEEAAPAPLAIGEPGEVAEGVVQDVGDAACA